MCASQLAKGKTVIGALNRVHKKVQKLVLSQPVLLAEGGMLEYYVAALEAAAQEVLRLNGTLTTVGSKTTAQASTHVSKDEQTQLCYAFMRDVGDAGLASSGGDKCAQLWDARERVEELSRSPKLLSAIKWRRARA